MAAASAPWDVTVALASGRAAELQLRDDERGTSAVCALASRALGIRVTALVTEDGRRLPEGAALPDLGLWDGAALTAVVEPVMVHGSPRSPVFLALAGGRFLASWGEAAAGGDSSSARAELKGAVVEKVCTTGSAVAVLTTNGGAVIWGCRHGGGDSDRVHASFPSGVRDLHANDLCLVALSDSGRVVAVWGEERQGDVPLFEVRAELQEGVREICATSCAFAAVKEDGRVVTWGLRTGGGSSEDVEESLSRDVRCVCATQHAFAALRLDGTVVTWGDINYGADSSVAEPYLRDVRQVVSGSRAFAALTGCGDMVAWGPPDIQDGSDDEDVGTVWRERGVEQVCFTEVAVAVLQADGAVKAGGFPGGKDDEEAWATPAEARSGVQRIYSASSGAFAALTRAGGVVTWGRALGEDDPCWRDVRVESGVEGVYSTSAAFAAVLSGGRVVAWGDIGRGGDCSGVQAELESGVVHVASTAAAFAAVKASGEVVTWGDAQHGGDSSAVAALLRPLGA